MDSSEVPITIGQLIGELQKLPVDLPVYSQVYDDDDEESLKPTQIAVRGKVATWPRGYSGSMEIVDCCVLRGKQQGE